MPPTDTVLYSQTSKFLTTQLQQLFTAFKLWSKYNTTLIELSTEYYNSRQQLSLYSSHEYYLPYMLPSVENIAETGCNNNERARTSVIHTLEMNEIYQLQQQIIKINHCISMLYNTVQNIHFISGEINDKYNNFMNNHFNIILGETDDFDDIIQQSSRIVNKVKKIKGISVGGTNEDGSQSQNKKKRVTYIDSNQQNADKTVPINADTNNIDSFDDYNNNIDGGDAVWGEFDGCIDEIFENLPLITADGFNNWTERVINRYHANQSDKIDEILHIDVEMTKFDKVCHVVDDQEDDRNHDQEDDRNHKNGVKNGKKNTKNKDYSKIDQSKNQKNKLKITTPESTKLVKMNHNRDVPSDDDDDDDLDDDDLDDDDDDLDEDDDDLDEDDLDEDDDEDEDDSINETEEERHMHVNWSTGDIKHEPNINPTHQEVLQLSMNINPNRCNVMVCDGIGTTSSLSTSLASSPTTLSSSTSLAPSPTTLLSSTSLIIPHPTETSYIQFDHTSYYTISHIYTIIGNQLDLIIQTMIAEFVQKKAIIKCLISINYDDVRYDLDQLSKLYHCDNGKFVDDVYDFKFWFDNTTKNNNFGSNFHQNDPKMNTSTVNVNKNDNSIVVNINNSTNYQVGHNSINHSNLIPPIVYAPLQLTSPNNNPTDPSNDSCPVGINHVINNMSTNGIKPNEMKQLMQLLELEPLLSLPQREITLQQIENIIRNELGID